KFETLLPPSSQKLQSIFIERHPFSQSAIFTPHFILTDLVRGISTWFQIDPSLGNSDRTTNYRRAPWLN
ncbi:hypothetical protein AVEN_152511-1, partial [Araneus ventricosus]